MKNLRKNIEAIPAKDFFAGGYDTVTFEAYGDEIYHIHNCPDDIAEGEKIKEYFLNHIGEIIIES